MGRTKRGGNAGGPRHKPTYGKNPSLPSDHETKNPPTRSKVDPIDIQVVSDHPAACGKSPAAIVPRDGFYTKVHVCQASYGNCLALYFDPDSRKRPQKSLKSTGKRDSSIPEEKLISLSIEAIPRQAQAGRHSIS